MTYLLLALFACLALIGARATEGGTTTTDPNTDTLKRLEALLTQGNKVAEDLRAKVDAQEARLRAYEDALKARGLPTSGDGGNKPPPLRFAAILRGMLAGGLDKASAWDGAQREREVGMAGREAAKSLGDRAMAAGVDGSGGYIVPPQYAAELIDVLTAQEVLTKAGATQLPGLIGSPHLMPRLGSGTSVGYVKESGTVGDGTPSFEQVSSQPHLLAGMVKMSRRVAALSNPGAEAIIRRRLARDMSLFMDLTGLRSDGSANKPFGIRFTPGVTVTPIGGAVDTDDLLDAISRLEIGNSPMVSPAIVCHPRTWNALRKTMTTVNGYLLAPDATMAARKQFAGLPVFTTTQIPTNLNGVTDTEVYVCDFSELWHCLWGGLLLEATTEGGSSFADHQVWLKATLEDDWCLTHTASFQVLSTVSN